MRILLENVQRSAQIRFEVAVLAPMYDRSCHHERLFFDTNKKVRRQFSSEGSRTCNKYGGLDFLTAKTNYRGRSYLSIKESRRVSVVQVRVYASRPESKVLGGRAHGPLANLERPLLRLTRVLWLFQLKKELQS